MTRTRKRKIARGIAASGIVLGIFLLSLKQISCGKSTDVVTETSTDSTTTSDIVSTTPTPAVFGVTSISPMGDNIAGGITVTLTGTVFATGITVTLGGNACTSITIVSSTSLTCVTPGHAAGTVDVVITSGSSIVTLAGGFTYSASPPPTVSSVSPATGTLGATTNITITGANFVATPTIKVGSVTCSTPAFVSSTSLTCTVAARMYGGTANVVVTNPDSQQGTKASGYTYPNATYTFLKSQIFNPTCQSCHGVSGGLTTGDYSSVLSKITTGNSAVSTLYLRVIGTSVGTQMPSGGPYLSTEEKASIADWIDQGGSNN